MSKLPYRPNVGAMLRRSDGLILIAERINMPGQWQFPQGGVDKGESLEEALWREVEEELGLCPMRDYCTILGQGPGVRYDFPPELKTRITKKYSGQDQTLFVLGFEGKDSDFVLDHHHKPEFQAIRWVTPREAIDAMWAIKRPILEQTIAALPEIFSGGAP
jgi:putative (di)nucleoside polyphosphate hydrolase